MAAGLITEDELIKRLLEEGCEDTGESSKIDRFWKAENGQSFIVPNSENANGRYPERVINDILKRVKGVRNAGGSIR